MTRLRPHILLGLLIAFAVTTTAGARPGAEFSMQGGKDNVITMVICAGDGEKTVTVGLDGDGQPHKPGSDHDCQSCHVCAAQAVGMAGLSPTWVVPLRQWQETDTRPCMRRKAGVALQQYLPRGPPKES